MQCEARAITRWALQTSSARWVFLLPPQHNDPDGSLAQGALPLWGNCDGKPADFMVQLRDKGKAAGTVYGKLTVKWEDRRVGRRSRLLEVGALIPKK